MTVPTGIRHISGLWLALALAGCLGQGPDQASTADQTPTPEQAAHLEAQRADGVLIDTDRYVAAVEASRAAEAASPVKWAPTGGAPAATEPAGPRPEFASAQPPAPRPQVESPSPSPAPQPQPARAIPPAGATPAPAFLDLPRGGLAETAVRPSPTPAPTTQPVAKPATADVAPAAAPVDSSDPVRMLAASLREHSNASADLKRYLRRAALSLYDPKLEMTEKDLSELPLADRRIVMAYQRLFRQLGQELGQTPDADRQQAAESVHELLDQLDPNAGRMNIRTAKLCRSVRGFGQYVEMSPIFLAGRQSPVGIYLEIDNFAAEVDSDGRHVVRLAQEVVLYNSADGLPVWRLRPARTVDQSLNRRRDFFTLQKIYLPATLTVGKYDLSVTVTDEVANRVDEAKISIQIVADPQLLTAQ